MTIKVYAIYRNGVFLPTTPVSVAEGAEVGLTVTLNDCSESLANILEDIANLPEKGSRDGFSGADHDQVLYGQHKEKLGI